MDAIPKTRFARNGDVHLAYQVSGEGPIDLFLVESWVHHVEMQWEFDEIARFLRRLGAIGRVVTFDRRGTGLSDPVPLDDLPDLETQVADALAVMDDAGFARPAVLGIGDGGLVAILFAAMHPDRCRDLVLFATAARQLQAPDFPAGIPEEAAEHILEAQASGWVAGGNDHAAFMVPSRAGDPAFLEQVVRYGRLAVRPGAVKHYFRQVLHTDVREALPTIQAPTLVIQREGDRLIPLDRARLLAERIPDTKLVVVPGVDHLIFTEHSDEILAEIQEFLTGARFDAEPDRILATLLFTDIVGSTERAAELGDRRWKELLDAHDDAVRREIARFRGREVGTTGDGFLATFDGPARAIRCAFAICEAVARVGLQIRAGVHTGECEVRGDDLGGLGVHIGARIASLGKADEVLVSSTVKDLVVGSGIGFDDHGEHQLKGVPGTWHLYAAERPSGSSASR